jgi:hypothetical protein
VGIFFLGTADKEQQPYYPMLHHGNEEDGIGIVIEVVDPGTFLLDIDGIFFQGCQHLIGGGEEQLGIVDDALGVVPGGLTDREGPAILCFMLFHRCVDFILYKDT